MLEIDAAAARRYAGTKAESASAAWCVTEFASALGIEQRTGQIDLTLPRVAWERFGRLVVNDLQLLPLGPADFHHAATLTLDAVNSLRAGDALHLACAVRAGARGIATLDEAMARHARRLKIKPILLR